MSRLPLDLPALREGAEEMAREAHDLFARLTWGVSDGWSELDDDAQETLIEVHSTLLRDLNRPASRDWWARWLARHHGLTVGATAPEWFREQSYAEGEQIHCWVLCARSAWTVYQWACFHSDGEDPDGATVYVPIPGISALTDPAAALRLAILAAAGRDDG